MDAMLLFEEVNAGWECRFCGAPWHSSGDHTCKMLTIEMVKRKMRGEDAPDMGIWKWAWFATQRPKADVG